jgi:2-polyprenyl-6-methoxyphenol hydroxylase-like FAD-dependent oxidoreductase
MKVIIIGAGITGLTLAAALAQLASQHEVELYERDRSPGVRRKGYAVSLKGDAGLAVLERLGLREAVLTDSGQQVTNFVIKDRLELLGSANLPADAERVAAGIAAAGVGRCLNPGVPGSSSTPQVGFRS